MVKQSVLSLIAKATAKAPAINKKTLSLLTIAGTLGITGLSMAAGSSSPVSDFVTCSGAQKINQYAQPVALFLAVIVFIVGIMMAAFEAFAKKYGHAIAILLFAIVITGFFWGAGKALGTYGESLKNQLCNLDGSSQ
jgi:uncharacterized YccA/Bax inhibitor family protein